MELTDAPRLTSLKFECIGFTRLDFTSGLKLPEYNTEAAVQQVAGAVEAMLQRLPWLVVLELPCMPLSAAAVQQLAGMQGLRRVSLFGVEHMPVCDQHLPSSITQLEYDDGFHTQEPSLPPQLQQLTGLLHLQLQLQCPLPPTLLGSVTQLQTLRLTGCRLLSNDDSHTEGTANLLDIVPKLARLQELCLLSTDLDTTNIDPQRFAALTAPSHLTRLVVQATERAPLPKGAVRHMFPAHRQQPQLRHLAVRIHCYELISIGSEWCIDNADLASISSCCPDLETLDVTCTVQPGADLSVLLQLSGSCAKLDVGGAAFTDAAAAIVVQLTQLWDLSWDASREYTDAGLVQLTALDLCHLSVHECGLSAEVCTSPDELDLAWWRGQGSVKLQLAALCKQSPVLARRARQQKRLKRELRRLA